MQTNTLVSNASRPAPALTRPTTPNTRVWRVPVALLALAAIPVAAGLVRLSQMSFGNVDAESARFFENPIPAWVHILPFIVFALGGVVQVSSSLRRRWPRWHRSAGRVIAVAGLLGTLGGLWVTLAYPNVELDGPVLFGSRVVVGTAIGVFILLGLIKIRQRAFHDHGAWMLRAYALAMGAGTQAFTHVPFFLFEPLHTESGRAVAMISGWAINLVVAEVVILRMRKRRAGLDVTTQYSVTASA